MTGIAPTPWTRDEYDHIVDANGKPVLLKDVWLAGGRGTPEEGSVIEANTRLFFAGPRMLSACEQALNLIVNSTLKGKAAREAIVALVDAINEARGEE